MYQEPKSGATICMNYKRLYTFGCSFTKWFWPTWADIIAYDLQIPYENWGEGGAGNVAIACKMLECDLKNTFNDTDLIIVNWSSWSREDRVNVYGTWNSGGNLLNNGYYDKKFVEKYWTMENDIVKNCTAIISSDKMFNINYQSHMIDYEDKGEYSENIYNFSNYDYYLKALPKKYIFDNSINSKFSGTIDDQHPDIITHLSHTKNIYKNLGLTLNTSTVKKYTSLQVHITNKLKNNSIDINKNWNNLREFFKVYNDQ